MSTAIPLGSLLRCDVPGAPVAIDQLVRLARDSHDETFDPRFLGRFGRVRGLLYDSAEQVPDDPLILVEVEDVGDDLFFPEELSLRAVPRPAEHASAP